MAVTSEGQQLHMLGFVQVPDGTTLEQVQAMLSVPENATLVSGG